jgi:hypothetical protein
MPEGVESRRPTSARNSKTIQNGVKDISPQNIGVKRHSAGALSLSSEELPREPRGSSELSLARGPTSRVQPGTPWAVDILDIQDL